MFTETKRQLQETARRARKGAIDLLNPKRYIYKPTSRFLAYSALAVGLLALSGDQTQKVSAASLDNLSYGVGAADCPPLPTDGRPAPFCLVPEGTNFTGQSYFGGAYFEDSNGDGRLNNGEVRVQGVSGRAVLVEEFEPEGSSDNVQIDPTTRAIKEINGQQRVVYLDVKDIDKGIVIERVVRNWTIFRIPEEEDKNEGIGYDMRNPGSDLLTVSARAGTLADKVWANRRYPDKNRIGHNCEGDCGWNCGQWIQFSKIKPSQLPNIDLNGLVKNEQIDKDPQGKVVSYTDLVWLWDGEELAARNRDFNAINTPLNDMLRRLDKVKPHFVRVPGNTVPYNNNYGGNR